MDIESARALKQELLATTLSPERRVRRVTGERQKHSEQDTLSFGRMEAERPKIEFESVSSPVALGIAAGKRGECSLAVRVQDRRIIHGPLVEKIRRSARDEVDVRFIGRPVPAVGPWHRSRCEPIRAGASIGSQPQETTGTLGCFVEPARGGALQLLSNAHVLVGWGRGRKGDTILQPGWSDSGRVYPAVASVTEFADLRRRPVGDDCAVATVIDGTDADVTRGLTVGGPDVEDEVFKDGRTTGRTEGRVLAIEVGPVEMSYPRPLGRLSFDDLTEVSSETEAPFGAHGDSGSVVLRGDSEAVGLLFAVTVGGRDGRCSISYLAPIERVLRSLKVRLVP